MGKAIVLLLAFGLVAVSFIPNTECRPQKLDDVVAVAPEAVPASPPVAASAGPNYPRLPFDNTERVTGGVDTILNGVGTGRLSEVLRGSFMFTPKERVRTIANGVIDSVFGKRDETVPHAQAPLRGF